MFGISGISVVRFHVELDGKTIESANTLEDAFRIALGVLASKGLGRSELLLKTVRTKDGGALFLAPTGDLECYHHKGETLHRDLHADTGVSIRAILV